jgi:threonyl-tRNA synthetase
MENQQLEDQLTPDELEARREEMKEFYVKSVPFLESQSKYEKLLTEIEESRYKRATMQIQYASMMAAAQGEIEMDNDEMPAPSPPKSTQKAPTKPASTSRKLKKG